MIFFVIIHLITFLKYSDIILKVKIYYNSIIIWNFYLTINVRRDITVGVLFLTIDFFCAFLR